MAEVKKYTVRIASGDDCTAAGLWEGFKRQRGLAGDVSPDTFTLKAFAEGMPPIVQASMARLFQEEVSADGVIDTEFEHDLLSSAMQFRNVGRLEDFIRHSVETDTWLNMTEEDANLLVSTLSLLFYRLREWKPVADSISPLLDGLDVGPLKDPRVLKLWTSFRENRGEDTDARPPDVLMRFLNSCYDLVKNSDSADVRRRLETAMVQLAKDAPEYCTVDFANELLTIADEHDGPARDFIDSEESVALIRSVLHRYPEEARQQSWFFEGLAKRGHPEALQVIRDALTKDPKSPYRELITKGKSGWLQGPLLDVLDNDRTLSNVPAVNRENYGEFRMEARGLFTDLLFDDSAEAGRLVALVAQNTRGRKILKELYEERRQELLAQEKRCPELTFHNVVAHYRKKLAEAEDAGSGAFVGIFIDEFANLLANLAKDDWDGAFNRLMDATKSSDDLMIGAGITGLVKLIEYKKDKEGNWNPTPLCEKVLNFFDLGLSPDAFERHLGVITDRSKFMESIGTLFGRTRGRKLDGAFSALKELYGFSDEDVVSKVIEIMADIYILDSGTYGDEPLDVLTNIVIRGKEGHKKAWECVRYYLSRGFDINDPARGADPRYKKYLDALFRVAGKANLHTVDAMDALIKLHSDIEWVRSDLLTMDVGVLAELINSSNDALAERMLDVIKELAVLGNASAFGLLIELFEAGYCETERYLVELLSNDDFYGHADIVEACYDILMKGDTDELSRNAYKLLKLAAGLDRAGAKNDLMCVDAMFLPTHMYELENPPEDEDVKTTEGEDMAEEVAPQEMPEGEAGSAGGDDAPKVEGKGDAIAKKGPRIETGGSELKYGTAGAADGAGEGAIETADGSLEVIIGKKTEAGRSETIKAGEAEDAGETVFVPETGLDAVYSIAMNPVHSMSARLMAVRALRDGFEQNPDIISLYLCNIVRLGDTFDRTQLDEVSIEALSALVEIAEEEDGSGRVRNPQAREVIEALITECDEATSNEGDEYAFDAIVQIYGMTSGDLHEWAASIISAIAEDEGHPLSEQARASL